MAYEIQPTQYSTNPLVTVPDLNFGQLSAQHAAPAWGMPGQDQMNSGFFNPNATGFGWNANTLKFGMDGLQFLGNIWGAWQANKLAKDQLNFTKKFSMANLNNQVAAYNTALEDRSRSRAKVEGQSAAEAQSYVDQNKLHNFGG